MNYAFAAKQTEYRRRQWIMVDRLSKKPVALRRVLYLDTKQGLETRHLLSLGYAPDNLFAVNSNPAEVALLTSGLKRDGLPLVHTIGRDYISAMRPAVDKAKAKIDVISFDGTGCLGRLTESVFGPASALAAQWGSVITMTLLAGRECGKYGDIVKDLAPCMAKTVRTSYGTHVNRTHAARVQALLMRVQVMSAVFACDKDGCEGEENIGKWCQFHYTACKWHCYMSESRQPMIWMVMTAEKHQQKVSSAYRRVDAGIDLAPQCWASR
jgi:hypothetical protein